MRFFEEVFQVAVGEERAFDFQRLIEQKRPFPFGFLDNRGVTHAQAFGEVAFFNVVSCHLGLEVWIQLLHLQYSISYCSSSILLNFAPCQQQIVFSMRNFIFTKCTKFRILYLCKNLYLEVGTLDKRTEIIKEMIEKRWPTQKAFAEAAGIPYTTLRSILQRGVGNSAVENVIKICRTLGITIEELEEMAARNSQEVKEDKPDLSEEEILTLAAHSAGYEGKLTEEQLAKIKLAIKIALAEDG